MRRFPWLDTSVKGELTLFEWALRGVGPRQVGQGQLIFTCLISACSAGLESRQTIGIEVECVLLALD